jgi:DNA polymerase
MPRASSTSAADFLPDDPSDLDALREAARSCRGCDLYRHATQTVFGAGSAQAPVLLVGEQPGDKEDLEGLPFVGPAGRELTRALAAAGLDPADAYVTNAVKHFKSVPRGKRRLHQKPNAGEVKACMPWLHREIEVVRPDVIVLLGATAAQALLGRDFRVTERRGALVLREDGPPAVASWHPSAILRQQETDARERMRAELVADLRVAVGATRRAAHKKKTMTS